MCLACVFGPAFASYVGSSFVAPPDTKGKILSIITSVALTVFTVQVIKRSFQLAFCEMTKVKIVLVSVGFGLIGLIYSLGVNYLINRYRGNIPVVPPVPVETNANKEDFSEPTDKKGCKTCCCKA
jgi:hypothetical protein